MEKRWVDYFKNHAINISVMSRDSNTAVGAVVVDEDNMIEVSSGYNCLPRGVKHSLDRSSRPLKYKYTSHAEASAISNAARLGRCTMGKTIFVTMFPCSQCMALLINSGIAKIVAPYPNLHHTVYGEDYFHSYTMAKDANISLELY